MVQVGTMSLCIDRFEASEGGRGEALSEEGAMPWVVVTWHQARLACELAGKHLCSTEEWEAACAGPNDWAYPYGGSYNPYRCNGADNDLQALAPSGYLEPCEGAYPGLFDMSGNAAEWTATCVGEAGCDIRGGSYRPVGFGRSMGCFDEAGGPIGPHDGFQEEDLGFRCCQSL